MSLLKVLMAQFGKSVTAANNFTLDASANNGTMRLARGNAGATTQDVLLVAADGKVDAPQGAKSAGSDVMRILQLPAKATTSGTFIDFSPVDDTGIPSWAKEITISLNSVSLSGTSHLLVQVGNSGGLSTTGYDASSSSLPTTPANVTSTSGFPVRVATAAASLGGHVVLTLGAVCTSSHTVNRGDGNTMTGGGTGPLPTTLDRIRLTTVNGTDTFDAGSVSIIVKG